MSLYHLTPQDVILMALLQESINELSMPERIRYHLYAFLSDILCRQELETLSLDELKVLFFDEFHTREILLEEEEEKCVHAMFHRISSRFIGIEDLFILGTELDELVEGISRSEEMLQPKHQSSFGDFVGRFILKATDMLFSDEIRLLEEFHLYNKTSSSKTKYTPSLEPYDLSLGISGALGLDLSDDPDLYHNRPSSTSFRIRRYGNLSSSFPTSSEKSGVLNPHGIFAIHHVDSFLYRLCTSAQGQLHVIDLKVLRSICPWSARIDEAAFTQALREGDLSTALDRLHALNDMHLARSGLHLFRQMDERRTISNSSTPVDTNTIDLDSRIFELTSRSFLDPVFRFSARIREIPSLARVGGVPAMVSALDLPQVSYAAMSVGLLYYSLGDLVTAEQAFMEALELSQQHNELRCIVSVTTWLLLISIQRGDRRRVLSLLNQVEQYISMIRSHSKPEVVADLLSVRHRDNLSMEVVVRESDLLAIRDLCGLVQTLRAQLFPQVFPLGELDCSILPMFTNLFASLLISSDQLELYCDTRLPVFVSTDIIAARVEEVDLGGKTETDPSPSKTWAFTTSSECVRQKRELTKRVAASFDLSYFSLARASTRSSGSSASQVVSRGRELWRPGFALVIREQWARVCLSSSSLLLHHGKTFSGRAMLSIFIEQFLGTSNDDRFVEALSIIAGEMFEAGFPTDAIRFLTAHLDDSKPFPCLQQFVSEVLMEGEYFSISLLQCLTERRHHLSYTSFHALIYQQFLLTCRLACTCMEYDTIHTLCLQFSRGSRYSFLSPSQLLEIDTFRLESLFHMGNLQQAHSCFENLREGISEGCDQEKRVMHTRSICRALWSMAHFSEMQQRWNHACEYVARSAQIATSFLAERDRIESVLELVRVLIALYLSDLDIARTGSRRDELLIDAACLLDQLHMSILYDQRALVMARYRLYSIMISAAFRVSPSDLCLRLEPLEIVACNEALEECLQCCSPIECKFVCSFVAIEQSLELFSEGVQQALLAHQHVESISKQNKKWFLGRDEVRDLISRLSR